MNKKLSSLIVSTMMLASTVQANHSSVSMKWRYVDALDGRTQQDKIEVSIPRGESSDPRIEKTIFLVDLANTLKDSMEKFHKVCEITPIDPRPIRPIRPIHPIRPLGPNNTVMPRPWPPIHPPIVPPVDNCKPQRVEVGQALQASIEKLSDRASENNDLRSDRSVAEVMDLSRMLAKNMIESKAPIGPIFFEGGIRGGGVRALAATAGGLNLTSGGAMDFGFFRKTVKDGRVPMSENLAIEGFLSEFDLSLTEAYCRELICVHPAVKMDNDRNKLFVQVSMNSNVTKENFRRKPLNLSVVLDISGSMSARDNTEKSRLAWAKQALIQTINELNEGDVLSIVLFDTNSEILVQPQHVTDKAKLIEKVNALKTKGSTNLELGLRDGFELVSQRIDSVPGDYESRVILISDAGINTGVTDEGSLLRLVTDYTGEGIGLTAIGLGLNFNKDFIHAITQSRGGNYLFVHSGLDMFRYFESFDFLVTPVAYNFKVWMGIHGLDAKLVKAYGVPAKEGEPVRELIDIQTLFFSEQGGAILLEYDIN